MDEQEFLRQVIAAPGLKKGYITNNNPQSIAFRLVPVSESIAILRGSYENETGRFFVGCPESGKTGTGKTLREAIKDLNRKLPSGRQTLHPAQIGLDKASSDFEVLQRLAAIANNCRGPHWCVEPKDSAEHQAGLRAEAMENTVRAVSLAVRSAILGQAIEHPEVGKALEAIVDGDTAKAYRLLFGEDLH